MGGPGLHRAVRFVGRRRELQVLHGMLSEAAAGGSPAVAVVGEPGIGKTWLAEKLAATARERGMQVLTGRGSEFEQDVPFGLAIDALDEQFGSLPVEVLARLGTEWGAELAAIFPSMAGAWSPLASSLDIERFRSHYAVRAVLTRLARVRPVLLVLDDLHWADPDSLELVAHLLRRGVRATMLVVVHRSQAGLGATAFGRATRDAGIHTLELDPLPVADLAESIGDHPDSPVVQALYDESGGNPFYFTELAKAPVRPDAAALAAGRPDPTTTTPGAVRAAIERELTALSPSARRFVQAAAVTGDPFDIDVTAAVADLTDDQALTALDELVASTIVQPTETPARIVFRHPIVRRAVYDGTGHGSRLGTHRRAAAALAARGAPVAARAHHVERSAAPGDMAAIALLDEAGRAAAPRAPSAAARWFAGAVRLLPPDAEPSRRLELLLLLAAAHAAAGRPQASRDVLEAARSHIAAEDVVTRTRITTQLAAAERAMGRTERARQLLVEALSHTDEDTAETVALTVELAMTHNVLEEPEHAVRVAARATERAEILGDRALVAAATVATGFALLGTGDSALEAYRSCVDRASELLADLPDDTLAASALPTLAMLGMLEAQSRNWRPAQRHAERGLRICRMCGRGDVYLPLMLARCAAATMKGDLDAATPLTDAAADAAALLDNDQWIAPIEAIRCWLLGLQGRTAKALAAGRDAVRAAERAPDSTYWWAACSLHAWALLEAGRHAEGRREFERVGGPLLPRVPATSRPYWLNALVTSYLATGELSAAQELVDHMEQIETTGLLLYRGEARHARASLLLAAGQADTAVRVAREAVALYEARELHLDVEQARTLVGRALVACGRTAAGQRELRRAHEELSRRGAARLADRAARELRALGVRVGPRTRPRSAGDGPPALSDREREVAELAAEGHTNRQIAEALFVTPKTVEAHLARVYAKLDVHSRAAMAVKLKLDRV